MSGSKINPRDRGFWETFFQALNTAGGSVFVLFIGFFFLVVAGQGDDIIYGLQDDTVREKLIFFAAVFWLGWQSWFWSRIALKEVFEDDGGSELTIPDGYCIPQKASDRRLIDWYRILMHSPERIVRYLPRVLGLLTMLSASFAIMKAIGMDNWLFGLSLANAAFFFFLVAFRRNIRRWFVARGSILFDPDKPDMLYLGRITYGVTILVGGYFLVRAFSDPVAMGFDIHSAPIIFFGLGSILAGVSFLIYQFRGYGSGIIGVLFIVAIIFGFMNENHQVRTIEGASDAQTVAEYVVEGSIPAANPKVEAIVKRSLDDIADGSLNIQEQQSISGLRSVDCTIPLDPRPDFTQAFETWYNRQGNKGKDPKNPLPLVVVATEGGGIRAAYWTAYALARTDAVFAEATDGQSLSSSIFAISGVSGGSVGTAFYLAALKDHQDPYSNWEKLDQALAHDFLGAAMTGLLYQDSLQTFLPLPVFEGRGAILEKAFETAWDNAIGGSSEGARNSLKSGIFSWAVDNARDDSQSNTDESQKKAPYYPEMLLNGTNDSDGKRMIAGTFCIDPRVFVDTYDVHNFLDASSGDSLPTDLRLSTAAHNSARFPVISPGGVLAKGGSRIIDGGYFENFGADTAYDLLFALEQYLRDRPDGPIYVKPIVIQISSDPDIGNKIDVDAMPPEVDSMLLATKGSNRLLSLISAPVNGILSTRSGHAFQAARDLRQWATSRPRASVALEEREQATLIGKDEPPGLMVDGTWLHLKMFNDIGACHPDTNTQDKSEKLAQLYFDTQKQGVVPPLGWDLSEGSRLSIRRMYEEDDNNWPNIERLAVELGYGKESLVKPDTCKAIAEKALNLYKTRKKAKKDCRSKTESPDAQPHGKETDAACQADQTCRICPAS